VYIVTGGAGFIGSGFVWELNRMGTRDIIIVDNLDCSEKWKNLVNLSFQDYEHKDTFLEVLEKDKLPGVEAVIHLGACSSTTETNADYLIHNNLRYSQRLAAFCRKKRARFIYASSAATFGDGKAGFSDDPEQMERLKPMNMYGYSKHLFDLWLYRLGWINSVAGLKFFNVYGPNEYHKGEMQSVVRKAYFQIQETGKVKLFKSYHPDYAHGEQKRDFIYLKDCLKVMAWLVEHSEVNGIFNLGSGRADSWNNLAGAVFAALDLQPRIEYIDMPEAIRSKYQYYTRARMDRLCSAGCPVNFHSLRQGVKDYVQNHLALEDPYLG